MKKSVKKMSLGKMTISNLDSIKMSNVNGGKRTSINASNCCGSANCSFKPCPDIVVVSGIILGA